MKINSISINEANKNFSKVTRLVDENRSILILKNNSPKYILLDYKKFESPKIADDMDIENISKRFIKKIKKLMRSLLND